MEEEPEPPVRPVPDDVPLTWEDPVEPPPAVKVINPHPEERPAGIRRVSGSAVASSAGADGAPRFGAPPRGKPRVRRAGGMRRAMAIFVLLGAIGVGWLLISLYQPGKGGGTGRVRVVIAQGAGAREIGDLLADKGVVSSGMFFSLRARLGGDREKLRSGPHDLKKDMSYSAALTALTTVPPAPTLVKVTIPEGRTVRQIVPIIKQLGLRGGYLKATRTQTYIHARTLGAPKHVKSIEGLLFPATYEVKPKAPAADLVLLQLKAFKKNIKLVNMSFAHKKNLSVYDVVKIASMIENEAAVPKDRRLIAAVIYNRLHQHIPLGIDATTRYETGNYDRPLTQSELQRNNGYNTRTHQGLPPTPISNPGLAALTAAANPANVPYLYYVVKPCGNGEHKFVTTDAEFQTAVAAYNRKRAQLGGKDPSHC